MELNATTRKCHVEKISNRKFKIVLTQGLNRQIRRMCEYFGYRVEKCLHSAAQQKELLELLEILAGYLLKNDRARVHLFSRRTDPAIRRVCVQGVRKVLQKMQDRKLSEDRFVLETCVDELSVSKCMKEQRILVDLREQPELYLQIVAISMGIPQIVKKETQFVRNGMNGRVLSEGAELSEVLDFYLGVLENWNEAMISSYEIGKEFSTEVLIRKWKEVLASFE